MNRKKQENNTTGFTGVYRVAGGRFKATITHNGRQIALGGFGSAIEASNEYNLMAKKLRGEFYNASQS